MDSHYMQGLDWAILGIYFAVLIAIGIWASMKRKKEGSLFLAEHSLRWHHIGFSMWGTNVGPSMLIASASAGFTTGIVSGNYAWYAFVFIALLAFVFAPAIWEPTSARCPSSWDCVSDSPHATSWRGTPLSPSSSRGWR
jgi:SSS family solute:Na+ symporter